MAGTPPDGPGPVAERWTGAGTGFFAHSSHSLPVPAFVPQAQARWSSAPRTGARSGRTAVSGARAGAAGTGSAVLAGALISSSPGEARR
jgi:hypothetical protein